MNKNLLATALFIPAMTLATSDIGETETQAAIDLRGECTVFANESEVPETWKIVDSCENYAPAKIGVRPEDVLKRRWQQRLKALSSKVKTVKRENVLGRARIGSGTLTRGGADRVKSLGIKQRARRTTTSQAFGSTKQFLLKDSRRLKKSSTDRVRRRNARAGIKSGTATEMDRTGQLSGKFWSTEAARRNQRLESQETTEGWKSYLDNRQYLSKKGRKTKKKYTYEGRSLRKMYRGTRLEGNIGN